MNAYVLDASVAAKWFLPATHETLTEQALRLFEDYAANRIRLVVPDLFWPEIGNLLEKPRAWGYCIEPDVCDSRRAAGKRRCSTLPCPVVGCAVSVGSRTVEA